jgi:O-antigen ligase
MKNELFLNKIYLLLWVAFAFFLPFSKALPNLLLIPILILFLFLTKYKEIHFSWKNGFLFLIISVTWISVSMIIQGGVDETLKLILKFYFLIGIFFLSKSLNRNNFIILYGFIGGCIIQFLISAFSIIKFYLENGYIKLDIGGGVNEILHGERPYIGFTFALSILFSLFIIRKFKYQWLYIWIGLATICVYYISARLAIVLCLLAFVQHLYIVMKHKKVYLMLAGSLLLFLVVLGIAFNKNFKKRMHVEDTLEETFSKFEAYEPRFIIWDCSYQISEKMQQFFGYGNSKIIEENLVRCYLSKIPVDKIGKQEYYKSKAFNTHNQFLSFFLLGGWFSLLTLILFFLISFIKSNSTIYSTVLLFFLAFFLFENVLHRQLGVHLFGLLLGVINVMSIENQKYKK